MKKQLFIPIILILLLASCKTDKASYLNGKNRGEYIDQINLTADWQIAHFKFSQKGSPGHLHDRGVDAWTNSTFLFGLAVWADKLAQEESPETEKYYKWLDEIGAGNTWRIPDNFKAYPKYSLYHADELCVAQFYLKMYEHKEKPIRIKALKERLDWILENRPDSTMVYYNKQSWTWCDALFMAPAVYAKLYNITNDEEYLNFMHTEFLRTYTHLYNKEYKLFYRDSNYFNKTEANGKPLFWGRGNGWVAAGLTNLLQILPKDNSIYDFYKELYLEFVPNLVSLMDEKGYWHASLLDPQSYPSPETSATALISYAIAYGINENLLERETYLPKLKLIWKNLQSFVNADGKLGWIQPIGADPKKVTKDMSSVYGVGAYLLAASEIMDIRE